MQVMALDIGGKRIGIATASTQTSIAMPCKVFDADSVTSNSREWRYFLEDYEPELLVFGKPETMQGGAGKQANRVAQVAKRIAKNAGLPYEFVDERLSSKEAKRIMHDQGMSEREMRGKLDAVAASVFLQTWLDKRNSRGE